MSPATPHTPEGFWSTHPFPACGTGAKEWMLTDDQLVAWQECYPTVDVDQELRKAWAWVNSSPANRKTARGYGRFCVGWLNRAVDRGTAVKRSGVRPGVQPEYPAWECPHVDRHWNRGDCRIATTLGRPRKDGAA